MKFLLVIMLFTGACIYGYRNKELVEKAATHLYQDLTGATPPTAGREAVVSVAQDPGPPAISPPAEPVVTLAKDEYYTRDNVRAQSGDSWIALPKGTSVRKIGEGNGRFVVECARGRVIIDAAQLTRDPVLIASLVRPEPPVFNLAAAAAQRKSLALRIQALAVKIDKINAEITAEDSKRQMAWKTPKNDELLRGNHLFLTNEITRLQHEKDDLTVKMESIPAPLAQDGR